MNWEAIGAVAEAVGAVGVIASLLYLAMQVRASTRASAVESKLASSRFYTDFLGSLIQSPELNERFLHGRKDLLYLLDRIAVPPLFRRQPFVQSTGTAHDEERA